MCNNIISFCFFNTIPPNEIPFFSAVVAHTQRYVHKHSSLDLVFQCIHFIKQQNTSAITNKRIKQTTKQVFYGREDKPLQSILHSWSQVDDDDEYKKRVSKIHTNTLICVCMNCTTRTQPYWNLVLQLNVYFLYCFVLLLLYLVVVFTFPCVSSYAKGDRLCFSFVIITLLVWFCCCIVCFTLHSQTVVAQVNTMMWMCV